MPPRRARAKTPPPTRRPTSADGKRATRSATERRVVLGGAFLSGARGCAELARRLRQTWAALRSTPALPSDEHDAREVTAAQLTLVARELLAKVAALNASEDEQERDARALAACALVELLRVFSATPSAALATSSDRSAALKCLLAQLRALGDAPSASKQRPGTPKPAGDDAEMSEDVRRAPAYVLEALAALKPSLVLTLLATDAHSDNDSEDSDTSSPLTRLFSALLGAIRREHSAQTQEQMLAVMLGCLQDDEMVDQSLLDAILAPLLVPPASASQQEQQQQEPEEEEDGSGQSNLSTEVGAYSLAQQLIRRASDQLETPLTQFLNGVLIDAPAGLLTAGPARGAASALKEHVYTLIYEVHRVRASLLLYVLPNVCLQLQVDEVATRADAVKLMGRLFASRAADYGQQFPKSFRDFLGRFRDASKEIRMLMVHAGALVWENKPELGHLLEKELVERLSDPEWEVRQLTVRELCDFCANSLELVSESCVRAVGERMKDKKVVLRKETMTGLGQVYGAHIAAYWTEEEEDGATSDAARAVPTENTKKLGWIPDYVLKCYAYPQQELRLRVLQLLDDILLPKHLNDDARASGLIFILQALDATSKEALRRILKERATCRGIVIEFLTERQAQREKRKQTTVSHEQVEAEAMASAQKLHDALRPLFPETNQLKKLLDQLVKWKDQSVFKHLASVCDAGLSQSEARKARDQVVRCVGTKTPLGEFVKNLCRKLATLTVNQATMEAVVRVLAAGSDHPARVTRSAVELLEIASSVQPDLLLPLVRDGGFDALLVVDEKRKEPTRATSRRKKTKSDDDGDEEEDEDEDGDDEKDPKIVIGVLKALANCSQRWAPTAHDVGMDDDSEFSPALTECLRAFCLGRFDNAFHSLSVPMQSEAARLAADGLANCYGGRNHESMTSLVGKLCAPSHLLSSSPAVLLCALQSLRVLVKRCSDAFTAASPEENRKLLERVWSAVVQDLVLSDDSDAARSTEKSTMGKKKQSQLADVRCLAIRVAANALVYCGGTGKASIPVDQSAALVKSLFELLRADGKRWGASVAVTARYRAAASCALLKLTRRRELEATLSVVEWHLLGFSLQDPSEDVRRAFLKRLTSNLTKHSAPHPHKYLSYLALAATEPKPPLKKSAKSLLTAAVERMRRMFEASLSGGSPTDDGNASARRATALLVPEYAVPYVIHLLAHHPDFPRALVEKHLARPRASPLSTPATQQQAGMAAVLESSMWSEQVAYLSFVLDGLVSTKQAARSDNIAFLLQILAKLSGCRDVLKPEAAHIYPLIDTAVALLTKKIKDQSNLKAFPGAIFVPRQLYAVRSGGSTRSSLLFAPGSADATGARRLSVRRSPYRVVYLLAPSDSFPCLVVAQASLSPIKAAGDGGGSPFLSIQSPILALGGSGKKRRRARQLLPPTPETRKLASKHGGDSDGGDSDEDEFRPRSTTTPPRRESLMRQARAQVQSYADASDDDADDDGQGDGDKQQGDADDEEVRAVLPASLLPARVGVG